MIAPVLTVIVPLYNEARTARMLLERVIDSAISKQIVVVDDGSTDETIRVVEQLRSTCSMPIELLCHDRNQGKGAAIRTGLTAARGEVVLIQDGDLEYDPADYPRLIDPILSGKASVVYGSRYLNAENCLPWSRYRVCLHLLNCIVRLLYRQRITDEATCYKAFRYDLLCRCDLRCERFEFCPEVTAKVCRMGLRIHEVPIRYQPRSVSEGKKIRWRDGVQAFCTLLYWRFARFRPLEPIDTRPHFTDALSGARQ